MKLLKTAAEKIGIGLLYGIGFGITTGAIFYFISEKMIASAWQDSAIEQVVITKHEKVTRNRNTVVLGTVENRSADALRVASIQVDLFDKSGNFVEQCAGYLRGTLRAGESRNFKVTCGDCKQDKPIVEHTSYKVHVTSM